MVAREVENQYFRIPELGNITIKAAPHLAPILILTSNSEKHLPDAFLHRCIYYDIPFPDSARLTKIVESRLGEWVKHRHDFIATALELFWQLCQSGLRKKPSTAELLNWLMVLREMFPKEDNPLATQPNLVLRTLNSLVKTQSDQQATQ